MAAKRFQTRLNQLSFAKTVHRSAREKDQSPASGGKMFRCCSQNGSGSPLFRGPVRGLWNIFPHLPS
jgi:hypothetical protein